MKKFFTCMIIAIAMTFIGSSAWARQSDPADSNTIDFTVNDAPVINGITPALQELYADGETTDIVVDVTAGTSATLNYEWFMWSEAAEGEGEGEGEGAGMGSWGPAPDATNSDTYTPLVENAVYRCVVTDGNGLSDTSDEAVVIVYQVPMSYITSEPAADPPAPASGALAVNPDIEGGVIMTAHGSGGWGATPELTYIWQISTDGGTSWSDIVAGNGYAIEGAILTIDPVAESQEGKYRCLVDDGHVE